MTIEEAKQLKSGDYITGSWKEGSVRKINLCELRGTTLFWSQENNKELAHSWNIDSIKLVNSEGIPIKRNMNYEIY